MIKLLYTVNGLRVNGVSAVIMQYITMLNKNDYKISLFTDEIAPQFKQVLKDNHVNVITSSNRKKNQLAYYKELKGILNNGKYDIIHAHGNSATLTVEMLAAKKCGVKTRIAHSHNTTCVHKFFDKMLRPLFYKTYTHGIGCGDEAGRWLFGDHPHVVIKNGIDLQKYSFDLQKRDEVRKKLGISDKYVVGHIGRFTEQKNHDFMIEVFESYLKSNPDSVLLLLGDGPRESEIKALVKEKKLEKSVIFYGTTPDTSVFYSAFDVFLFPSKFEGVPLTLVEAQANGLPCVISDKISPEVIVTKLIRVKSLSDQAEWARELQNVSFQQREQNSRQAVKELTQAGFEISSVVKQVDDLYKIAKGADK